MSVGEESGMATGKWATAYITSGRNTGHMVMILVKASCAFVLMTMKMRRRKEVRRGLSV